MKRVGSEWDLWSVPFQLEEQGSAPSTPQTNKVKFYAKDNGSNVSTLAYKNDAGTEILFPTSGAFVTGSGTANRLAYWTSSSVVAALSALTSTRVLFADSNGLPTDASTFTFDSSNVQLVIGALHGGSTSKLDLDNSGANCVLSIGAHNNSGLTFASLDFYRSLGTHASPTVLGGGDRIGRLQAYGYDGNSYELAATIQLQTDTAPSDGSMPGSILFSTTASGSVSPTLRLTIDSTGLVTVAGSETVVGTFTLGGGASASELRFLEPSGGGSSYTGFKAPALAGNVIYTLPTADGASGQVLSTNGSGTLSWAAGGDNSFVLMLMGG